MTAEDYRRIARALAVLRGAGRRLVKRDSDAIIAACREIDGIFRLDAATGANLSAHEETRDDRQDLRRNGIAIALRPAGDPHE